MIRSALLCLFYSFAIGLYAQKEALPKTDTVYYSSKRCNDCPETSKAVVYTLLRCGLYRGSDGTVAYRNSPDKNDSTQFRPRYLPWVIGSYEKRVKDRELIQLRDVVDTLTFVSLGKYYWADQKAVYGFIPIYDNGILFWLEQADPKTFVVLPGEHYTKDKNRVYYRGHELKGADTKTFRTLAHPELNDLACDNNNFYQVGDKMKDIEIKAYKLEAYKKKN